MFDILQTLANGCSTNHTASCITLIVLWVPLIAGAAHVLVAVFTRPAAEKEEK